MSPMKGVNLRAWWGSAGIALTHPRVSWWHRCILVWEQPVWSMLLALILYTGLTLPYRGLWHVCAVWILLTILPMLCSMASFISGSFRRLFLT